MLVASDSGVFFSLLRILSRNAMRLARLMDLGHWLFRLAAAFMGTLLVAAGCVGGEGEASTAAGGSLDMEN